MTLSQRPSWLQASNMQRHIGWGNVNLSIWVFQLTRIRPTFEGEKCPFLNCQLTENFVYEKTQWWGDITLSESSSWPKPSNMRGMRIACWISGIWLSRSMTNTMSLQAWHYTVSHRKSTSDLTNTMLLQAWNYTVSHRKNTSYLMYKGFKLGFWKLIHEGFDLGLKFLHNGSKLECERLLHRGSILGFENLLLKGEIGFDRAAAKARRVFALTYHSKRWRNPTSMNYKTPNKNHFKCCHLHENLQSPCIVFRYTPFKTLYCFWHTWFKIHSKVFQHKWSHMLEVFGH